MAIAADSHDRVAEPQPADDPLTAGALLGATLGVGAVALVFAPPVGVLVVLALACVAILLVSCSQGLPVARLTSVVARLRHTVMPLARAVTQWAQGLSMPERRAPAFDRSFGPAESISAPAAKPPHVVAAAPVEQATEEMPAVAAPAVAAAHAAPADDPRLAAMHLGELHQRSGDSSAAIDAFRQAAHGEDSLACAAALSLGVLLEARGDVAGAEAAYRQAAMGDTSASQSATMLLGWLTRRREYEAA